MSRPIDCPFDANELYSLYSQNGLGSPAIAKLAAARLGRSSPISHHAVKRWLTDAGIAARGRSEAGALVQTGHGPFRAIDCPVSAGDLRRMYEDENLSAAEIAQSLSPLMDRSISYKPVLRWLREAAIDLRPITEARRIASARNPNQDQIASARERLAEARAKGLVTSDASHMHTPEIRSKVAAANRARGITIRVRVPCANPYCGNILHRRPSSIRDGQVHHFCNHRCEGVVMRAWQSWQRRHTHAGWDTARFSQCRIVACTRVAVNNSSGCIYHERRVRPGRPKLTVLDLLQRQIDRARERREKRLTRYGAFRARFRG